MKIDQSKPCVIYMKGKSEATRDDTDIGLEFRQESYFFYLTGIDEPNFQVIIDIQEDKIYLIAPSDISNEDDVIWKGPKINMTELLERYDVDEILAESEISQLLAKLNPTTVYVLKNKTQYINAFNLISSGNLRFDIDNQQLLRAMDEARLTKFQWEIEMIRQAAQGSSEAHVALMKQCQPGMTEAHLAALFRWSCALNGIYKQAYLPIVASGPRASILHHAPRYDQHIPTNSLVLVDAGGEKLCYGSDITRTFPVQGVFSTEARVVYSIVLKMQKVVLSRLKPGVYWEDMQQLAIEVLCKELVRIGILVGDINLLIEQNVPCAFYYHGLGHTLGLDVHDVGGKDTLSDNPQFLLGRPLETNMVLTVEPGLYFNDSMLSIWTEYPGYQDFFNMDVLDQYRSIGGVRIEDTVVITQDGHENLTKAPKEIDEIEAIMKKYTPTC
ncbi:hypothetical protein G6F43_009202 [Rhizopus delemar]|nr:hypothetical protein G6F43_009202 [Rhizopus delemar]